MQLAWLGALCDRRNPLTGFFLVHAPHGLASPGCVNCRSGTITPMRHQVYIFRGAPASGKGAVVPAFAEHLPLPVALIEQDKMRWGIHLIGRNITDVSAEEHRLANRNTTMLYEQYLKTGRYTIVLEGLFTWDDTESSEGNVRELADLAGQYDYDVTSIVLRASKEVLSQRNTDREYSVPAAEFDALYDAVYDTIDESELVIDSTDDTVEQTVGKLRQALQA